jgi:class 3 adenylate cyclase/tetratricopeptide (TPR) repeat protein
VSDLKSLLAEAGLSQYADLLEQAAIDIDVLPYLTEAHLKELGIPLGHQIRLLRAAKSGPHSHDRIQTAGAAEQVAPSPGGAEFRQLTVLFCDLVGSTQLSQSMDAEALRELMQAYQECGRVVVTRYEGHVAQYLGDGMMVYFGWPRAHEDDAERALRSALDLVEAVKHVAAPRPLQIHVGVATGSVVVGETGVSDVGASRLAVGETPNLAARLQALAEPDAIVVAESTWRLAGRRFDYEDLGEHDLKGILQPVRAYRVRGLVRVEGRFEAARSRVLTPLVGRASEVALLLDRWERARGGEGQGVLLSAEAGIGKSRVTRALREQLEPTSHLSLHYQCSPFHSNSDFYPVIEHLERAADFRLEDDPDTRLEQMEALLSKAQVNVSEIAPLFAALLSLPMHRYPSRSRSPQQQKEQIIAALLSQVIGLANHKPVLVVLEDAHWADPSTLEVFGALLNGIDTVKALVVITYRPEFNPPWLGQSRVTALRLARLSRKETARLAQEVSGKPLPDAVLDQILAKTDGVPLFVEELTKAVLESGLLQDAGERFVLSGPLPPLAIPSSLHDSLMARLDRLAPVKELIQLGAVIGREFSRALIAKLARVPEPGLDSGLEQLVESGLMYRRGTGADVVYVFKHALVQDAAYASILKSRRVQLHAAVAEALQKDDQLTHSEPEFLARQFECAGLAERAIEWYMVAGQRATLRSANREALHHFQRALELLDGMETTPEALERRIDLNTELGLIHITLQGWASKLATGHFMEAERLSREQPYTERRFRTLVGMSVALTWSGNFADAKSRSEELVVLADHTAQRIHGLYARQVAAQRNMYEGRFHAAIAEARAALGLYDEAADISLAFRYGHDPGLISLWWGAYCLWETGAMDQGLGFAEQALALARRLGHPFSLATSLMYTVDIAYFMWLPERIESYADEAVDVARRYGFSHNEAWSSFHRGWAAAQRGRHEHAIEVMSDALARLKASGTERVGVPRMTAQLASVYGLAGRADEGLRLLEQSPDRAPGRKPVRYAEISRIEGELYLRTIPSDPAKAESLFHTAIAIAIEDGAKSKQLRATTSLAQLWLGQGKRREAEELLRPLYQSFEEGAGMPDMRNAKALLDTLNAGPRSDGLRQPAPARGKNRGGVAKREGRT